MDEYLACMIWADLGAALSAVLVCGLWAAAKRRGKQIPWCVVIAVITACAFLGGCLGKNEAEALCQNAPTGAIHTSGGAAYDEAENPAPPKGSWLLPTLTVSGIAFVTTGLAAAVSEEMDRSAGQRRHP